MNLLLPNFSVLQFLTSKSKGQTLEFVLYVKMVRMVICKKGFRSLTVLNISIASVLILLIDSLQVLSRRIL